MTIKLFAFWKYDLFPFIHGGKIKELQDKGIVEIEDRGCCRFQSFKLTNAEERARILEQLNQNLNKNIIMRY